MESSETTEYKYYNRTRIFGQKLALESNFKSKKGQKWLQKVVDKKIFFLLYQSS